jgi:hypothetical protein
MLICNIGVKARLLHETHAAIAVANTPFLTYLGNLPDAKSNPPTVGM